MSIATAKKGATSAILQNIQFCNRQKMNNRGFDYLFFAFAMLFQSAFAVQNGFDKTCINEKAPLKDKAFRGAVFILPLFRSEKSVAGIAETGKDITVFV